MSGGHYEYKYQQLQWLADEIENDFVNGGKYMGEDYTEGKWDSKREYDRLEGATPKQREQILKEINSLICELRKVSARAKELGWLLSGDTGIETYLKRLKEI